MIKYIISSILLITCFFSKGQEQLLLDSVIYSGFEVPNFGFTYGEKYSYDSELRLKSRKADHFHETFEYGIRSSTNVYNRENGEKIITQTNTTANGDYTEITSFFSHENSTDTTKTRFVTRTTDIYGNTKEYKSYEFTNNNQVLRYSSRYEYNSDLTLKLWERSRFNSQQIPLTFERNKYYYNENSQLDSTSYDIIYHTSGGRTKFSTIYEYDNLGRLIYVKENHLSEEYTIVEELEYFLDFYTSNTGGSKYYYYYSESEHFPFDSIIDYRINDGIEVLRSIFFNRDVSADNPDFDLSLLSNKAYYNSDDGTLQNFRQEKQLFIWFNIPESPLEHEIEYQIISNPTAASYYFNIITTSNAFDAIKIFDDQGRLIKTHQRSNFSTHNLRAPDVAGIYFVQLWNENKRVSETKKLMIY